MSETEKNTQGQRPQNYSLATISMLLSLLGAYLIFSRRDALSFNAFAFGLGIIALIQIKRSGGLLGKVFAIAGISMSVFVLHMCVISL